MRLLVFGETGQVARELQRQAEVIALGRDAVELGALDAIRSAIEAHDPDAVINAAAFTAVDRAEVKAELAMRINGEAPGVMAQCCAAQGIAFLHISTDYVFDGSGETPWQETDPVAPRNIYGQSKLAGEQAVISAGGNSAILRTSWVFSAHGSNFVKTMLCLSESRERLDIVADQIGCPTPAGDIAATLLQMARMMVTGRVGGIYHYAGQPPISRADFAREIFAQAGRVVSVQDIRTANYPTPAVRPLNSRLDCRKLEADFGISPPDWQAGLQEVLNELGPR